MRGDPKRRGIDLAPHASGPAVHTKPKLIRGVQPVLTV
jgi:hypothetical protein